MSNSGDVKYLSPVDVSKGTKNKYCRFKKYKIKFIDYKDPDFLLRFLNEQGKILPRRITGNSVKFQKKVSQAIKRSRHLGFLPYVTDLLK